MARRSSTLAQLAATPPPRRARTSQYQRDLGYSRRQIIGQGMPVAGGGTAFPMPYPRKRKH